MNLVYSLLAIAGLFLASGCSDKQISAPSSPAVVPTPGRLGTVTVVTGLNHPVFVGAPEGDWDRLFVVEKAGIIRLMRGDQLLQTPFLDITDRVGSSAGEQGLLGLAFHPQYQANGFFFVNYTDLNGNTVVSRFVASSNPDQADASSEQAILRVDQPFSNHNAGMVAFSPLDGYLYIGLGDGGSGGDPQNIAQTPLSLLGKMLRVNVDGALPYTIPDDNPYKGATDTLAEIWSFGLRNPWRYSFDRLTGELYIGDVGQNQIEEINYAPASSTGGENYGWRLKEGSRCFNPSVNCDNGLILTDPIAEYSHSDPSSPCSVTGGYVYRGSAMPNLAGAYFFADFCSGQVWSFVYRNGKVTDYKERTSEIGIGQIAISSFGQGGDGELYVVDYSGSIYKLTARMP